MQIYALLLLIKYLVMEKTNIGEWVSVFVFTTEAYKLNVVREFINLYKTQWTFILMWRDVLVRKIDVVVRMDYYNSST